VSPVIRTPFGFGRGTIRVGCQGLGYVLVPCDRWDDCEYSLGRRDCKGCHDCNPKDFTKSHYKRRPKKEKSCP